MFAIHVKAKNDLNGNPRRLYLVCSPHGPVAAVAEGYDGSHAIRGAGYEAPIVADIHVQPAEYKRLLRAYPASRFAQYDKPRARGR